MANQYSTSNAVPGSSHIDYRTGDVVLSVRQPNRPGRFARKELHAVLGQSNKVDDAIEQGQSIQLSGVDALDMRLWQISQNRQIYDRIAPPKGKKMLLTHLAQDGRTDFRSAVSSKVHFGKHRLAWHPSITEVVFSCRAVNNTSILASGTGSTSGEWQANGPTGNGPLLQAAIDEMVAFQAANQDHVLISIWSDIGASDMLGQVDPVAFRAAYRAMVDEYRGSVRDGDTAIWIMQMQPPSVRAQHSANSALIHQAMLDLSNPAHPDYIPRCVRVEVDDLPTIAIDPYHFTYAARRVLGERAQRALAAFTTGTVGKSVIPSYFVEFDRGEQRFVNRICGGVGEIYDQRFALNPDTTFTDLVLETAASGGSYLGFDTDWKFDPSRSYTKAVIIMRKEYPNLAYREPFICGVRQFLANTDPRYHSDIKDGHIFSRNLCANYSSTEGEYLEFTETPGVTDASIYGYWRNDGVGTVDGSNRWVPPSGDTKTDFRSRLTWLMFGMTFNAETQETRLYFNGVAMQSALNTTAVFSELGPQNELPGVDGMVQLLSYGHTNLAGTMRPFGPQNFNGYLRRAVLYNGRAATATEMSTMTLG